MGSVAKQDRERALRAVAFWCASQIEGIELPQHVVESLGLGSVEAIQTQLNNWDVPRWITHGDGTVERPKKPKPAPRKRQARSSGPAKELPPAGNAAPLFREKLEALIRATEELKHRKEKLQGKRFVQSAVYKDPVLFFRDVLSDDQWQHVRELFDLDPDAEDFLYFGGATFSLGGGASAPQAPLPALIGAYLLAGGEPESLVEALHLDPASTEWPKIKKRIEGRKGDDNLDGLKALAEQLATLICGGMLGRGSPVAELSNHEINFACRITERREAGAPDEEIYEDLLHGLRLSEEDLSWDEFRRLADLQLKWPCAYSDNQKS